jgi:hypothetical protein
MGKIKEYLYKCLSGLLKVGKDWWNRLTCATAEAGRTESYIETVSPPQADTLHKAIKTIDAQTMAHEFESIVRWALPILKLKGKHVKLGVDVTEDSTWTEYGAQNTRPSTHKNMHHIQTWQYLNISIIEPFFVPLMSLPYRQTDDLDTLVISLLKYVKTLPLIIDLVLYDRGFYHAHLIDFMENLRGKQPIPYLIFARKTEAVKDYIYLTNHFDWFEHTMKYSKDKSVWHPKTTLIVWKPDPIVHPDIAWPFATNQEPRQELMDTYPKRWNHETGFRVHDEGHIKSKSSHPLIRFFYHLLGMLLLIIWRIQSVRKQHVVFKRYLKAVEYKYREKIILEYPPPSIIVY